VGLTTGLVSVAAAAPAAAAAPVNSYTSGGFTVGDSGPSNPSPVTVTVPAGTGKLLSLSLTLLSPNHANPSDMTFDLRSPSGASVRIGCTDGSTSFSDSRTCASLAPFYGTDPAGTWQLFPYDTIAARDDWFTSYGGFTLTLSTAEAPAVTADPTSATTPSGTAVTFTSAATGTPTPTVQWQVDSGSGFTNLPGATSASLSLTPTLADSGKQYRAVYSNTQGTATSTSAALTVLPVAPSITVHPSPTTVSSGSGAVLVSNATSDPVPTVQWERASPGSALFSSIAGATGTTLTLAAVRYVDDGTQYRAVYTNAVGTAVTDPATLTVTLLPPSVTQNPSDASVASGAAVSLVAGASSEVAQTVRWQSAAPGGSFSDMPGATSTTLTFTAAFAQDGYRFQALFTNPAGTSTTTAATLSVSPEGPVVTSSPSDLTVEEGDPATFSASASGDPVALAQWQVSTDGGTTYADVPGATLGSFTIPAANRAQHLSLYRAVFTNPAGQATTTPARLQVQHSPEVVTGPSDVTVASGAGATFTADAVGTSTPTVQWRVSTDGGLGFVDIAGATSPTLHVSGLAFADSGTRYRAVFTNSVGTIATRDATLTVSAAVPVVTTDIADQRVVSGTTVTFAAAATGDPAPTVQWRVSSDGGATFSDIVGATHDTYTFTAAVSNDGFQYVAVYTNVGGTDSTTSARLTVVSLPAALGVTGANSTVLALVASLLVAVGAVAAVVPRRRRTAA
jgi:hypothetical protein